MSYRIDLKGEGTEDRTLPDPYLSGVYDADGNRFTGTADDDGGEGRNSRVFFTATETATYYVSADAFGIDTGTYKLSVNQVAVAVGDAFGTGTDVAADTDTTGAVDVGYSVRGRVNFAGDRDWFAVTLEAGKTYQIDLKGLGTGDGTLLNPYLHWVHDADGNRFPLTTNENGGEGGNSRVFFTATEDGTHYVAAGSWGLTGRVGTYTLSVTDVTDSVADDFTPGIGTSGTVTVGGSVTGEVDYPNDRDWFAVVLEAGTTYRFDLKGSDTGDGTLADPYLGGVHDADGDLLPGTTDNNGGTDRNSRVEFTATENATYYVAAGAWVPHHTGDYTLSVEEVM